MTWPSALLINSGIDSSQSHPRAVAKSGKKLPGLRFVAQCDANGFRGWCRHPKIMFVGGQLGNQKDLEGKPFVCIRLPYCALPMRKPGMLRWNALFKI
jgi:hypothetical protein